MTSTRLPENVRARIESMLDSVDAELHAHYPGPDSRDQPIHTAYVGADRVTVETPKEWGAAAVELLDSQRALLSELDTTDSLDAVRARLEREPIQDMRIDFEDGYGFRSDAEEDAAAANAGAVLAAWGSAAAEAGADLGGPGSFGLRMKGLAGNERRRALRTLELVLDGMGGVPDGFVFTVPKIRSAGQAAALAAMCEGIERGSGLAEGTLRFELQIESPQAIIAADGTAPIAKMIAASGHRCSGLHFGTYDYTAACGVAATDQALDHPAADFAKSVMQVAAAQTGVWVCDGSTQIVPDGDPEFALRNHHRLVGRALTRGYYQGWDMHPAHLVTRWLATYDFFRKAIDVAVPRLEAYLDRRSGGVMDEPATAEALAATVLRGLSCGARTAGELPAQLTPEVLRALVARRPLS
ncbi:DUF6986 family protein [Nocardia goodfellowii]|uniref:Citrate lyase beta subunit n=1 Tax=Nocardia goodfellowii TaxID=882446 RepID=A0ABS4QAI3_9NOCA|nr:citrate lyase beta subunit [Nocardia goodfellowii]